MPEIFVYYLLAFTTTILTGIGQINLKLLGDSEFSVVLLFKNKHLLIASLSFFCSLVLSIFVLNKLNYTVFYSITALNFVSIAFLSKKYLNEQIDLKKWIGILIIVGGLIIFNF